MMLGLPCPTLVSCKPLLALLLMDTSRALRLCVPQVVSAPPLLLRRMAGLFTLWQEADALTVTLAVAVSLLLLTPVQVGTSAALALDPLLVSTAWCRSTTSCDSLLMITLPDRG